MRAGVGMVAVPMSARWLSGLGVVAFLLSVIPLVAGLGPVGVFLPGLGLLCVAACAVPPFFRRRDHFRVACAAAGMTVAAVSVPVGLFGILAVLLAHGWLLYLAFAALPATAIAGLVAGFQRAKGLRFGGPAVVVAWLFAVLTVLGWGYVTVEALTWDGPFTSRSG
ncbi:hypothetical protein ABZW03_13795 [Kitasatospora sp. NPDC004799]|uniref:hypothetical protein n=1 Tax=Kitasatospora sp. NPDC004799 TaxID=3154460 RepID=UPI0033B254BF